MGPLTEHSNPLRKLMYWSLLRLTVPPTQRLTFWTSAQPSTRKALITFLFINNAYITNLADWITVYFFTGKKYIERI